MTKPRLKFSNSHTSQMVQCICGDVFSESGTPAVVDAHYDEWERAHANCSKKPRADRKVFWLSFCDGKRPKGQQFLGACVVEVTGDEAEAALIEVLLRFPLAQPGSEWIAAASRKAHQLGCNPGGEMASMEIPVDYPHLARYPQGVLMDRATIEALEPPDAES